MRIGFKTPHGVIYVRSSAILGISDEYQIPLGERKVRNLFLSGGQSEWILDDPDSVTRVLALLDNEEA